MASNGSNVGCGVAGKAHVRIEDAFARLKEGGGKALVTFVTAGDPDMETSREIILTLERAGADMVELGVPFSDPMADGPTIQAASERALKSGTTLKKVLRLVGDVRRDSRIPIILFGYYNPIFRYGLERFARDAKLAGVDGLLVVDLPPEEAGELKGCADDAGLDLIYLVTPTSDENRMRLITSRASGFIYYISVPGVTGARSKLAGSIPASIEKVRRYTDLPICVGFGISTPLQASTVAKWADGVVVGSAIIKVIEANLGSNGLVKKVGNFVGSLRRGMDG